MDLGVVLVLTDSPTYRLTDSAHSPSASVDPLPKIARVLKLLWG
jgi:hypothetical protein